MSGSVRVVDSAAACLLDVVVFACGDAQDVMPLTAFEPKCMLCIANRPLIWYCLAPWIATGVRRFFLCVNEEDHVALRAYVTRAFVGVDFHFVRVPLHTNERPSTTCDAVCAFLAYKHALRTGTADRDMDSSSVVVADGSARHKTATSNNNNNNSSHDAAVLSPCEAMSPRRGGGGSSSGGARDALRDERAALAGLPRDAVLLSCDTILAGVCIDQLVRRHYTSMASATAVFFRPRPQQQQQPSSSAAAAATSSATTGGKRGDGGGGGKKKAGATTTSSGAKMSVEAAQQLASELRRFTHTFAAVGYEEDDVDEYSTAAAAAAAAAAVAAGSVGDGVEEVATTSMTSPAAAAMTTTTASNNNSNNHVTGKLSWGGSGDDDVVSPTMTAPAAVSAPLPPAPPPLQLLHRRLHFVCPLDDKPEVRVTMAFAARRPHLTFAADVVDAQVYVVRQWVLHFIAAAAAATTPAVASTTKTKTATAAQGSAHTAARARRDDDSDDDDDDEAAGRTVQHYILPLLARSQHTTINAAAGVVVTPDAKLQHSVPTHWMHVGGDITVERLNAVSSTLALPARTDNVRVYAAIYEEQPHVACKIYRIDSAHNYAAANHELVAAKTALLRLDDGSNNNSSSSGGAGMTLNVNSSSSSSGLAPCDLALAYMLPDHPLTLRAREAGQQVSILASFLDTTVPPNVYVTRSVIGHNVTLAPGARITDSVVLANAEVGAGAVVARSVVGTSAIVNAGTRVVHCTVAPRCIVEEDEQDCVIE